MKHHLLQCRNTHFILNAVKCHKITPVQLYRLLHKPSAYNWDSLSLWFESHIQVALVDWFWWSIHHTTSFHARMGFLGVALILLPFSLWNRPPQKFWGVNRHFPAKHAKYSNFHITKTTECIPTKLCSKYSLCMVPKCTHKSKWQTDAIFKKIEKLPYLCNHLTNVDKL